MINLVIVDDHPIMIEGIRNTFDHLKDINVIGTANDANKVFLLLKKEKIDLVLIDINMPNINGFKIAQLVREEYCDTKIVFFTQFDNTSLIKKALDVGAHGYVNKGVSKKSLIRVIKQILKEDKTFIYKTV